MANLKKTTHKGVYEIEKNRFCYRLNINKKGLKIDTTCRLDENGRPYVGTHTYWGMGKFGRFQGMSQNISYTLTPEKIKKFFLQQKAMQQECVCLLIMLMILLR